MSATHLDFIHRNKQITSVVVEHYVYTVGKDGVVKILEHAAQGEGDRWFYDVHYESGTVDRVFTPEVVQFKPITNLKSESERST